MRSGISIDYDWLIELVDERAVPVSQALLSTVEVLGPIPLTGEGLLSAIEALPITLRPLRHGSPLRVEGNFALIDLFAATAALEHFTDFTLAQGAIANIRARDFEEAIQSLIDSSSWAPPSQLRRLRGVHLRVRGQQLTDVDAIGCRNGVLLLVSAKSRVFHPEDDSGTHRAVRESSSLVVRACEDALRLDATLDAAPIGDNFDFGGFNSRVVIVCTPYPIYTPKGIATEDALKGLRRVVSFDELVDFLRA